MSNARMDDHLKDSDICMLTTKGPQQVDYVSLVHNFTGEQIFKINLRDYVCGHRLIPYSGDTYGLYAVEKFSPFNPDTGSLNVDYDGNSHTLGTPKLLVKFNRGVYEAAKDTWANYWQWKKERNKKRSVLEEQFGYDTKHAMHLVRLLRMGAEALETGVLNVRRPDAEELLRIRDGAWSYDQLVKYAEEVDEYVKNDLYKRTHLPRKADVHLAAKIMMEVQDLVWTNTN